MKNFTTALLACICLVGCVSQINLVNADRHTQAGLVAERSGDWTTARSQFAQAVVNADLADANPHAKAIVNYEYGRALGVGCAYESAEKYLLRSKSFAELNHESPYLPVYELGVLSQFRGKAADAQRYFEMLIPLLEIEKLDQRYPMGVVDVYIRYAQVLEENGLTAVATDMRAKADSIRAAHPDAKPISNVTPYGSLCSQN